MEDEAAANLLTRHIWRLVKKARHRLQQMPGCQGGARSVSLLLPADFLNRLGRDVVRMAEGEKHGVRGCTLHIEYADGEERVSVGKIKCDPHITSTTHLHLQLTRASTQPKSVHPIFKILGQGSSTNIYISPGYLLEKRKM
ncbi:protein charybde-like isoform X2 [Oratosquilla oratoria]